jgi:hypothetical protein
MRCPSTASMMIKKRVWEALGKFPEDLRACEDLLFFDRFDANRLVIRYAPEARVRWHIPNDFGGVFRRFRAYSAHTLKAGLGNRWHRAVVRMYAVGLLFLLLAAWHHWAWLILPGSALLFRIWRTVRMRKSSLTLRHSVGLKTYAVVGIILLWIDAALFAGALDYLLRNRSKEEAARL